MCSALSPHDQHFSLQNICITTHSTVENTYLKAFLSPHGLNIRTVKTILVGVLQWKVAQIFDALKQLFQPKKYHRPCKRSPNGEKLPDPSFTYVELCSKCFLDIYCYYKSFKKSKQRLNRNLHLENKDSLRNLHFLNKTLFLRSQLKKR